MSLAPPPIHGLDVLFCSRDGPGTTSLNRPCKRQRDSSGSLYHRYGRRRYRWYRRDWRADTSLARQWCYPDRCVVLRHLLPGTSAFLKQRRMHRYKSIRRVIGSRRGHYAICRTGPCRRQWCASVGSPKLRSRRLFLPLTQLAR
jgi:hypothetical protein